MTKFIVDLWLDGYETTATVVKSKPVNRERSYPAGTR